VRSSSASIAFDYSKGIAHRLSAFERFLQTQPDWRGKVTYLQIAPKSRTPDTLPSQRLMPTPHPAQSRAALIRLSFEIATNIEWPALPTWLPHVRRRIIYLNQKNSLGCEVTKLLFRESSVERRSTELASIDVGTRTRQFVIGDPTAILAFYQILLSHGDGCTKCIFGGNRGAPGQLCLGN
jgi:hypothetical protein